MGDSKYQDPRYQKRVREWVAGLRSQDHARQTAQAQRSKTLGSLNTAGRAGFAPGVPEPLWNAKVQHEHIKKY